MKKVVKYLLFLCLSPIAIFIAFLSLGSFCAMKIYHWATDDNRFFENFFVGVAGEIAWLGVLIFLVNF